jgi:predicted PurR-regulated permease PerM
MNNDKFQFPYIAKWIFSLSIIALVIFLMWYFRFIVVCILLALILAFMGTPIQNLLHKFHVGKFHFSRTITTIITLLSLVSIFTLLGYIIIPLFISQAMEFANLDVYKIADYYAEPINKIENFLLEYQLLPPDKNLEALVSSYILDALNTLNITNIADATINLTSNIVMGTFIVLFITFFFLKDNNLVNKFINAVTPDLYLDEIHKIISSSRSLISRYFLGIFSEIVIMIAILSLGFYLVGLKNVILIATICGVMVILPYIGVLIGGIVGLMVCLTSYLGADPTLDILPIVIKFLSVFTIVKLIDDFVLQPLIYSKSVKAHPLEIFLVILMAGEVGGILGMIFAIPVYTLFRIIAKEFFVKWKFIKKITENL